MEELRLRLDGAIDPVAELAQLAQRDDELGAVACSSYCESLLRAKGIAKAPEVAQMVRTVAAESAVNSADPARRAVGEAQASISALDDALICTVSITRDALEAAGEAATMAGVVIDGMKTAPGDQLPLPESGGKVKRQPESIVVSAVRNWLVKRGFDVTRHQQGMGSRKGFPDLTALRDGITYYIEVKTAFGKLSPYQEEFRDVCEAHGGTYICARGIDDLVDEGLE